MNATNIFKLEYIYDMIAAHYAASKIKETINEETDWKDYRLLSDNYENIYSKLDPAQIKVFERKLNSISNELYNLFEALTGNDNVKEIKNEINNSIKESMKYYIS